MPFAVMDVHSAMTHCTKGQKARPGTLVADAWRGLHRDRGEVGLRIAGRRMAHVGHELPFVSGSVGAAGSLNNRGRAGLRCSPGPVRSRSEISGSFSRQPSRYVDQVRAWVCLAELEDPRLQCIVCRDFDVGGAVERCGHCSHSGQVPLSPRQKRHPVGNYRTRQATDYNGAPHHSWARGRIQRQRRRT